MYIFGPLQTSSLLCVCMYAIIDTYLYCMYSDSKVFPLLLILLLVEKFCISVRKANSHHSSPNHERDSFRSVHEEHVCRALCFCGWCICIRVYIYNAIQLTICNRNMIIYIYIIHYISDITYGTSHTHARIQLHICI